MGVAVKSNLEREKMVFLFQPIVNNLYRFEPCEIGIVDMMGLVVEHHELVQLADNDAEVIFESVVFRPGALPRK